MKHVLVIYYSQSGQLETIARNIAKPLAESKDIIVSYYEIQLEKPFPFPWNNDTFFNAFPESFLQIPTALKPVPEEILNTKYDLILLNYQVWYLTPSIPINSFLKSAAAQTIFNNTSVVTISGSRNMWFMAQEKIKTLLKQNKANLKGNIALVDRVGNLISVITIVEWMFSGIKKKYLGLFPLPGVSEKDINESTKFGNIILSSIQKNDWNDLQFNLIQQDAVRVSSYLVRVDKTGNKIFNKWSNFIITKTKTRKNWTKVFKAYLLLAIWIISPIVYILHVFTYPLFSGKRKKLIQYYKGIN